MKENLPTNNEQMAIQTNKNSSKKQDLHNKMESKQNTDHKSKAGC